MERHSAWSEQSEVKLTKGTKQRTMERSDMDSSEAQSPQGVAGGRHQRTKNDPPSPKKASALKKATADKSTPDHVGAGKHQALSTKH